MKCINCGKESLEQTCLLCELEIRAREKPQFLKDMEWVAANNPPQSDFQRAMQTLLQKKPQDFLARIQSLQREYDAKMVALAQAAKQPSVDTPVSTEVDEGTERLIEVLERLLKEVSG